MITLNMDDATAIKLARLLGHHITGGGTFGLYSQLAGKLNEAGYEDYRFIEPFDPPARDTRRLHGGRPMVEIR